MFDVTKGKHTPEVHKKDSNLKKIFDSIDKLVDRAIKHFKPVSKNWKPSMEEGKLTEAKKETIFDVAEQVLRNNQAYPYKSKRGKVLVDIQSANLLVKVWKKINTKMKKILTKMGEDDPKQLMNTLWAVANPK